MNRILRVAGFSIVLLALSQCKSTPPDERREAIQQMRSDVLSQLFELKPDVRNQVGEAAGYGVFSSANINVILASFGFGVGVVRDNSNGQQTYMRMGEAGIGIGAGLKDFRAVFVFHDPDSLDRFINQGWTFGGQADAAAKAGDLGAAVAGEAVIDNQSEREEIVAALESCRNHH